MTIHSSWSEGGSACSCSVSTINVGGSRDERAEAVMEEIEAGWDGEGRYMVEYTDYDEYDEKQVFFEAETPQELYEKLENYWQENNVYTDDSPYVEKQVN